MAEQPGRRFSNESLLPVGRTFDPDTPLYISLRLQVDSRALVVTKSNIPHQIISMKTAIVHVFSGDIEVVSEYDGDDHILASVSEERVLQDFPELARAYPSYGGGDLIIRTPDIVRLINYNGYVKRGVTFTRINVFTRDAFRCMYCGIRQKMNLLTYDHVVPRDHNGKTTWENIVTSCHPCNGYKANRTPEQAGMKLRKKPVKPKYLPQLGLKFDPSTVRDSWRPFLGAFISYVDGTVAA